MSFVLGVMSLYERVFGFFDRVTEGWLLPTLARFVFLAVLFMFFWKSAMTKLGDGFFGFLSLSNGAYFQIVPKAVEAASYQPANVSFTADLIVFFGTWGEIILPVLVVVGLLTRLASLGMIGFVVIMTYVDLTAHNLKPEVVGTLFDGQVNGIWDQRLLWVVLLFIPVLKGPGPFSLDFILGRVFRKRAARPRVAQADPTPHPSGATPDTSEPQVPGPAASG